MPILNKIQPCKSEPSASEEYGQNGIVWGEVDLKQQTYCL